MKNKLVKLTLRRSDHEKEIDPYGETDMYVNPAYVTSVLPDGLGPGAWVHACGNIGHWVEESVEEVVELLSK